MSEYIKDGEKLESVASEAAVLGSMMIDMTCIPHVLAIVNTDKMFFREEHRHIFNAIVDLHIKGVEPIDAVMLRDQLVSKNLLQAVGGVPYIGRILDTTPSAANHKYYANIVRERMLYRKFVFAVGQIGRLPQEPGTVNEQIEALHKLALDIQIERQDEAHTFGEDMGQAIYNMVEDKGRISTGFVATDRIIRGYLPGQLIIVAGRPNMAKTSFALCSALTLAKAGKRILIFSLEMTKDELLQRCACSMASVDTSQWPLHGSPPIEEQTSLYEIADLIEHYPITIYDTVNTVQKVRAITDVLRRADGVDMVIIDNLQIMTTEPHIPKEYDRIAEISRVLKRMAVELAVPVMLISHLSREVDKRNNHRPMLSDLRGSGTIEQDANLVMFIYRQDVYTRRKDPNVAAGDIDSKGNKIITGQAEMIYAKNRGGRTGTANLVFMEEYTLFADLAHEQPEFEEAS